MCCSKSNATAGKHWMAGFNGEKLIQTDSLESASEYTTTGLEETYLERAKGEREMRNSSLQSLQVLTRNGESKRE